ncbi:hypothetical protein CMV37_13415 [Bacillus cereus]|nr:hypothetical protein CMV37_13415 [Bacillus cereus]
MIFKRHSILNKKNECFLFFIPLFVRIKDSTGEGLIKSSLYDRAECILTYYVLNFADQGNTEP